MAALSEAFVRLRPETTGFRTEAERRIGTIAIPVKLRPDTTGFRAAVTALLGKLTASVRLTPNVAGFAARTNTALRALRLTAPVRLVPDTRGFRLGALLGARVPTITVRPTLDLTAFRAQYRIFEAVYLRDRSFTVHPNLSPGSLGILNRLLHSAGQQGGDAFGGGFASSMSGRSKLIAAAVAVGALALKTMMGLIHGLILAGGALGASLPLAVTGIIAAVGTLKLAFNGVGDAFKLAFATAPNDVEKLNEALKKLAPAARAVVLEVRASQAVLKSLQQTVQQNFFAPLVGVMRDLNSNVIPILRRELGLLATGFGTVARQVLYVIAVAAKTGQLSEIFGPLRTMFTALGATIPGLVGAFLTLARAAGPFAEILTGALVRGLTNFTNLVNAAAADGRLAALFRDGLAVLRSFAELLSNLASIAHSVFAAFEANGVSAFATLSALTGQLAAFLKTAEGQQALSTLAQLLGAISHIIGTVLTPLLPIAGQLVSILGGVLVQALTRLAGPLGNLAEMLARVITPVMDALSPIVGQLATVLTDFLVLAVTELAAHFRQMAPVIQQFAAQMGPHLIPVVQQLGKVLLALVPLIPALSQALLSLLPLLIELIPVFVAITKAQVAFGTAIATLIGWFVQLIGWVAKFAALGIGFIFTEIAGLVRGAVPAFSDFKAAIASVGEFFSRIWGHISGWFTGTIVPSLREAGSQISGVFRAIGDGAGAVASYIRAAWDNAANFFKTWIFPIFELVGALVMLVFRRLGDGIGVIVGGIRFIWDALVLWFRATILPGITVVLNLITVAYTHMRDGIGQVIAAVRSVWDGLVAWFRATIQPAITAFLTGLTVAFQHMRDGIAAVVNAVRSAWDAGWAFLRDRVFGPLANVVTVTIPNAFSRAADLIGEAWSRIRAAVSVPVRFVIETVINRGIIDTFNTVARALGTTQLPHVPMPFADGGQVAARGQVRAFADGGTVRRFAGDAVERFANGGMSWRKSRPGVLHGPGGPREDRVKILASPGEYLVNARDTGWSLPILEWINSRRGRKPIGDGPGIGGFQNGGLVGALSGIWDALTNPAKWVGDRINALINRIPGAAAAKDLAVGMGRRTVNALIDWIRSKLTAFDPGGGGSATASGLRSGIAGVLGELRRVFGNVPLISGLRPGSRTLSGALSYHASGRAIDISPVRAWAQYIHARYGPQLREHITPWQDLNLRNGRPHTYTGAVWNQHNFPGGNAHIHAALRAGGLVANVLSKLGIRSFDTGGTLHPGQVGVNTSRYPETLLSGGPSGGEARLLAALERIADQQDRIIAAITRVAPELGAELRGVTRTTYQMARAR